MNYSVIIRPEAEADLAETFLLYEDKRQGLGYDFLLQIEAGLKVLERTPAIHPLGYKETRNHFTRRFPYKMIYLIEQETVIILAVLHTRRAPKLLKKRLRTASQ